MKIDNKLSTTFLNFCCYHFISPSSSSSLPIVNINSQLSHSFRGVVTYAKLALIADTQHPLGLVRAVER